MKADTIELYVRHSLDKLNAHEEWRKRTLEFTNKLRGDIIINGQNPRMIAAGLVYIVGVYTGASNCTQLSVAKSLDTSVGAVRKSYKILRVPLRI